MASTQQTKDERAEAAARAAADELSDLNRKRREYEEECTKMEYPPPTDNPRQQERQERTPGITGSILQTVKGALGHAKDAGTGKTQETGEKIREGTEVALKKASQTKDAAALKAEEMKGSTKGKAGEYKDYAVEKAKESKDYTAEKAKEGKDTTLGKISELKDSAVDAARRAMDYLTGKKEEEIEKELQTGEAKEKYTLTEDEARRKMQELKLQEEGYEDEDRKIAEADRETAADRGIAGRKNIFGSIWSVKDTIKDKLTQPTDVVNETRVARELGGTKRIGGAKEVGGDHVAEEVKLVDVDENPAGAKAPPSRKAISGDS